MKILGGSGRMAGANANHVAVLIHTRFTDRHAGSMRRLAADRHCGPHHGAFVGAGLTHTSFLRH
jgi:hypothetical protein